MCEMYVVIVDVRFHHCIHSGNISLLLLLFLLPLGQHSGKERASVFDLTLCRSHSPLRPGKRERACVIAPFTLELGISHTCVTFYTHEIVDAYVEQCMRMPSGANFS